MTSCVKELFVGLGKEHLLPDLYENPDLCMVRDVSGFSTEELAEIKLKEEIQRERGRKEYARQKMKGIGIGGASYEQRVEWYARQKMKGIGIGGAPHEQRVEWGQASYQRQVKLGNGIGGATSEQLSEWGKLGGKLGYAISLAHLTEAERSENGRLGYKASLGKLTEAERSENGKSGYAAGLAKRSADELREYYAAGLGKLSHEDCVKNGTKGGKISGARTVESRRGCIGRKMEEWEAYFPNLEAFVKEVSNNLVVVASFLLFTNHAFRMVTVSSLTQPSSRNYISLFRGSVSPTRNI